MSLAVQPDGTACQCVEHSPYTEAGEVRGKALQLYASEE